MKKISIAAVLVGGVVDIVSTNIFAVPFVIFVFATIGVANIPKDHMQAALVAAVNGSFGLMAAQWLIGAAGSATGGYVAAWMAKREEVLNGALSAYLCLAIGLYAWFAGTVTVPAWQHVLGFVLSPALGAFGGYLRQLQRSPRAESAQATP